MHTGKFRIFVIIRLVASVSKLGQTLQIGQIFMTTSHHDRELSKRYFKPCAPLSGSLITVTLIVQALRTLVYLVQ